MLVTCKACKKKVDRDIAFKVNVSGKNNYYCNEDEYNQIKIENESRLRVIDLSFEIIGKSTNTILMKELSEIAKVHTYKKLSKYLEENLIDLSITMDREFSNEYGKIKYFTTIIRNQIGNFVDIETDEDEIVHHEIITAVNYSTNARKTFNKYIEEYGEEKH